MTLQRFLTGLADHRCSWPLGLARFKPRPDARMGLGPVLVQLVLVEVFCAAAGLILMGLFQATPVKGSWWPMQFALGLGLVSGLFAQILVAVAWNRRAARLRAAGLTAPPEPPRRRWWQTFLVVPFYCLVFLVLTPLALLLAIDNAVGTLQWRRARAELMARGEPLTFAQLVPARPPDDRNFAMTPLLRPLFDYSLVVTNGRTEFVWRDPAGRRRPEAIGLPSQVYPEGYSPRKSTNDGRLHLDSYARGIRAQPLRKVEFDLPSELATRYGVVRTNPAGLSEKEAAALVIADPAREVLDYLRRFDAEMQEIGEASRRPESQFPVKWSEGYWILLPHVTQAKRFTTLFRVRAAARLASGDPAGAFADTVVLLHLAEKGAPDPILIGLLVRLAQTAIATSAVWEGLAARQWNEAQLAELQAMLLAIDIQKAGIEAFQGERAFGNWMYDGWLESPQDLRDGWLPPDSGEAFALGPAGPVFPRFLAPRGLIRRNQIAGNRMMDFLIARLRQPDWAAATTRAPADDEYARLAGVRPMTPNTMLAAMLFPAIARAEGKLARQCTVTRLGAIACALERHRLQTGRFPEALDELGPRFPGGVPSDPMSGQPFRYRRLDNGWFQLWSVGANGRDDGGVMKDRENDAAGDWVWPVPVPSAGPRLL